MVRYLVKERHVACAQIVPWIESVYLWDGQMETAQESKVILKTTKEKFEDVKNVIHKLSQYEIPEISAIEIDDVNQAYAAWVEQNMRFSPRS